MQRIPEPELMDHVDQARAYSQADFSEPHTMFVDEFRRVFPGQDITGQVLDLGCGPADVTVRFARSFPQCHIDAVDGAATMLQFAQERIDRERLGEQITLLHEVIPATATLKKTYATIISNSLLHHLADPFSLWDTVSAKCESRGRVFIMDLMRPETLLAAEKMVRLYAKDEPQILQHDFYHSLLAAYQPHEVRHHLKIAGLDGLQIESVTDRHLVVYGELN